SRFHLELERAVGGLKLSDLGSTNGTFVDAIRVDRGLVPPGVFLRVGRTRLKVADDESVTLEMLAGDSFGEVHYASPLMRRVMAQVQAASGHDASVLLLGESGTGKELLARALHMHSRRASGPFETVDCGALAPSLIASELFGHERGAFTGADKQH